MHQLLPFALLIMSLPCIAPLAGGCSSTCETGRDCCAGQPCSAGPGERVSCFEDVCYRVDLVMEGHHGHIEQLVTDQTHVYWTDIRGGAVMKIPKHGGEAVELAVGEQGPASIAVDASSVYWTAGACIICDVSLPPTVKKAGLEGGPKVTLATAEVMTFGLALGQGVVYFSNLGLGVWQVSKDGGASAPLYGEGMFYPIALGTSAVFTGGSVGGVDDFGVYRISVPDGALTLLAKDRYAFGLALDAKYVYWLRAGVDGGAVMRVPQQGGDPLLLAEASPSGRSALAPIAVHDGFVYWSDQFDGEGYERVMSIRKVRVDGGRPAVVVGGIETHAIAVDDAGIYFTDGRSIMRAAK